MPQPLHHKTGGESPSHRDILDAIADLESQRKQDAEARADLSRRIDTQALVQQRIESKLDDLLKITGWSGLDKHGQPIGEGIAGDLMRLKLRVDKRFSLYDGWAKYAAGVLAAITIISIAVWRIFVAMLPHPH